VEYYIIIKIIEINLEIKKDLINSLGEIMIEKKKEKRERSIYLYELI
jgi:hypothetical protein